MSKTVITELKCPDCGLVMYVPRNHGRLRAKKHVKDMFCVGCGRVQKFVQMEEE